MYLIPINKDFRQKALDSVVSINTDQFAKADIGGFDAGASMDWQAFSGAGFKFNDTIVGSVGYRYLSVDYTPNNSTFDVHLNGVFFGLGFRF